MKKLNVKQLGRWLLFVAGLMIIILMFWDLVLSKHGYFVFQAEKKDYQSLKLDIKRLTAEKEVLQKRIIRLREDPKALEAVIHKELGYVYPDETMIIMPELNVGQEVKNP